MEVLTSGMTPGNTELPEGLTVDGNLDISYTGLRELPEGLMVGGWLDCNGQQD